MLKGFRDFILRGNVVDLAVAVIIGTAFGAVVTAFTKGIVMQTARCGAVIGKPDFDNLIMLNGAARSSTVTSSPLSSTSSSLPQSSTSSSFSLPNTC